MSITILDEIEKAQVLANGLRKNEAEAKQLGITTGAIDKLDAAAQDLKQRDEDVESMRRQLRQKVRENNRLLMDLKTLSLNLRRLVKKRYLKPDWMRFGVQDKR